MKRTFFLAFGVIAFLELLSFLLVGYPLIQSVFALGLAFGLFFLMLARPEVALTVLLSEYILGSKGYLFRFELTGDPDRGLPIRILFFTAFVMGWLILVAKHGWWRQWMGYLRERSAYLFLAGLLVFAFIRALLLKNSFALADANAWGVLILVLPLLDLAYQRRFSTTELTRIGSVLLAALCFSMVETLALFYFFSHGFPLAWTDAIYRWIRFTGVGEITRILPGQSAFRIFFQSHIYELLAFGAGLAMISFQKKTRFAWLFLGALFAVVLVSFSRSFWIGLVAMVLIFIMACLGRVDYPLAQRFRQGWSLAWTGLLSVFIGVLMAGGLFLFPFPGGGSTNFADLVLARTNGGEEAVQSRWQLLPILWHKIKQSPILGGGFGATVTYQSKDPRIVQKTGGTYTTYAFEWGWVDFWVKFGILGIPVMLFFLIQLAYRIWRSSFEYPLRLALVVSIVGLAAVHVFTPYLNHPLGLVLLLAMDASLAFQSSKNSSLSEELVPHVTT